MNNITITGNLTRDPELKFGASGTAIVKLGVAVSRKVKEEEQTSFFDVVAFGSLAEHIGQSLHKGYRVTVGGRLEQRTWETDKGEKRSSVEIIADDVAASLRFNTLDVRSTPSAGKRTERLIEDAF
jgi:single-strand DNA-binding protein